MNAEKWVQYLSAFDISATIDLAVMTKHGTDWTAVGELSLEGHMRSVKGILSMAMAAAKQPGIKGMIVPAVNAQEAAVVESLEIIPVHTLQEAVGFLNGQLDIDPVPSRLDELFATFSQYDIDFSDVRGQDMAKRALTIAAAGSHNLLMLGPPGSGETEYMLASPSYDTAMCGFQ